MLNHQAAKADLEHVNEVATFPCATPLKLSHGTMRSKIAAKKLELLLLALCSTEHSWTPPAITATMCT